MTEPTQGQADGAVAAARRRESLAIGALVVVAIAIRLALAPRLGFFVDLDLFAQWAAIAAEGGSAAAHDIFSIYPSSHVYVLRLLGAIDATPGYLLLKAPALLADGVLAATAATLAVRLSRPAHPRRVAAAVAAGVLLNPAVLAVGAAWGQVDAVPAALVVSGILVLVTGRRTTARDAAAIGLLAAAVTFKPQAALIGPAIAFTLHHRHLRGRGDELRRGVGRIAIIVGAGVAVWALSGLGLGHSPLEVADVYSHASYTFTSVWAFNLWGAVGFYRPDASGAGVVEVIGIPAFYIGIGLYLAGTTGVLWRARRALLRGAEEAIVICASTAAIGILSFAVMTRMHERYLSTALALLAPLVVIRRVRHVYVALSVLYVVNLWYPFAYFNVPLNLEGLWFRPVFDWLFGPLFEMYTWQKRGWSIVALAACLAAVAMCVRVIEIAGGTEARDGDALEPRAASRWTLPGAAAAVAVVNLFVLRAETMRVENLNDSSLHLQMVRWALHRLRDGHLPLDGWFPFYALGSAHFHHYQSLPHTLTALFAHVTTIDVTDTYLWLQYLLLATWPIAVYLGARMMGMTRGVAAATAVLAPLLVSKPGYGLETGSYVWQGYGVYSQLWGMWVLPLALGLSWRAISRSRGYVAAGAAVAALIAFHFLTAYLALIVIATFAVLTMRGVAGRVLRTAGVLACALGTSAWVLVPLLVDRDWSAQSEFYEGTIFNDSYGARRVLGWLVTGELFDHGRYPVVTVLAAIGLVVTALHARTSESARAVLAMAGVSLLLFFGRPTIGPVLDLLPGSGDLQVHRFISGVHLAGLLLAGIGLAFGLRTVRDGVRRIPATGGLPITGAVAAAVVAAVVLLPAHDERAAYSRRGAALMRIQRDVDRTDGADLRALIDIVRRKGGGRAYAGLRGNWGANYLVGAVPVHVALANADIDAIGSVFRTISSLSTDIEVLFDETNPAHYELLNIRYVLLDQARAPSVDATLLASAGRHRLYEVETTGYFQVADRIGFVRADRSTIAEASRDFLASREAAAGRYRGVAFDGRRPPPSTLSRPRATPAGFVERAVVEPRDGFYRATVRAERDAAVVLKVSYHPRWTVTVDGRRADTVMMSPSLLGVDVDEGDHEVVFRYRPYPDYGVLALVGVLSLAAAALVPRWWRRRRR
ncbi:MAG TPA: DUF6541 family protein [Acidimicrobiales bacterium]|nr:DUF6541 family protein [Acidimicrobiales bacterium]